jgi:hypothetical protein
MNEPRCPDCRYPLSECACFDDYEDDEIARSYDRDDDTHPSHDDYDPNDSRNL